MDENWKISGWSKNVKIEKERRAIREGVSPDKEKRAANNHLRVVA